MNKKQIKNINFLFFKIFFFYFKGFLLIFCLKINFVAGDKLVWLDALPEHCIIKNRQNALKEPLRKTDNSNCKESAKQLLCIVVSNLLERSRSKKTTKL